MKYEIIIEEKEKTQKFLKEAIAEYEKRLGRYCKVKCLFVKKEKDLLRLYQKDDGMEHVFVLPGKAEMTSERLSEMIAEKENTGVKGISFFVPTEGSKEKLSEHPAPVKTLILSDFTISPAMSGMILCEQIYRGYRILHNHPYHK